MRILVFIFLQTLPFWAYSQTKIKFDFVDDYSVLIDSAKNEYFHSPFEFLYYREIYADLSFREKGLFSKSDSKTMNLFIKINGNYGKKQKGNYSTND